MRRNWPLCDLRWYHDAVFRDYSVEHWWNGASEDNGQSELDRSNETLCFTDPGGRRQIRVAPWLWEILRRHPELQSFREAFLQNIENLPELGYQEYQEKRCAMLAPWIGRGAFMIESLALWSHLPWESKGENEALNKGQRDRFSYGASEYSEDKNRFPDNKLPSSTPHVFRASFQPTAEGEISKLENGQLRQRTPKDFTVGEFMDNADRKGNDLLILEVSRTASVSSLLQDFKALFDQEDGDRRKGIVHSSFRQTVEQFECLEVLDGTGEPSTQECNSIRRMFSRYSLCCDKTDGESV